jgi:membrane-bound lytic murein transglycosylase MltF
MTKTASQQSKKFAVVTFGSEDNFDLPNDREYKELLDRLVQIERPEDIAAMPIVVAGNKTVRLHVTPVVLTATQKVVFKRGRSRKAPENIVEDKFVKRAMTQLDISLSLGKPRFILVPYYAKVVVENAA